MIVVVCNADFVAIAVVFSIVVTVVGILVCLPSRELKSSETFAVTLVTLLITDEKSFEVVVAIIVGKSTIAEFLATGEEFCVAFSCID